MALDFGMALSRGLVAPDKALQDQVKALAGGTAIFKTEDWWNTQLNKQIREGYSETKTKTQYLRSGSGPMGGGGTQWADVQTGGFMMNSMPGAAYSWGQSGPQTRTVSYQEQKDLTAAQLDAIQSASKKSLQRTKSEVAGLKSSNKRLSRGTGGLVAKAAMPGTQGMSTGLPILGEGGLGIDSSSLGGKTRLG